jgi:hypothetical protein
MRASQSSSDRPVRAARDAVTAPIMSSGDFPCRPQEMSAACALGILSVEFLVHAWDFAQATGQQVAVSD